MTQLNQFTDPYSLGAYTPENKDKIGRIQCDVAKADYQFLQLILPSRSEAVIQRTYAILTKKLITILKHHGITDINSADEYKSFIANIRFVDGRTSSNAVGGVNTDLANLSGGTPLGSLPKTNASNDGRGTAQPSAANATLTHLSSNLPSKSSGTVGAKKKSNGKTTKGG